MDYALLTVGSLFTVGVMVEECDGASMTEMEAAAESIHKMVATTTAHVMPAKPQLANVMSTTPGPAHMPV